MSHATHSYKRRYHLPHGLEYHDTLNKQHLKAVTFIAQSVWLITGLAIELLAVRFMLAFLGANPANGFFGFIYDISQPLVAPFTFVAEQSQALYRFELHTLVAIAAYAFVGYGLARLLSNPEPHLEDDE